MWVYAIGFLAQAFFSARILIQWILSERAKRVVSPTAYWVCSLAGSYLLFVYGWLRDDFAIILGQMVSYYIYLWNLNAKGDMAAFVGYPADRAAVYARGGIGRHSAQRGALLRHLHAERERPALVAAVRLGGAVDLLAAFRLSTVLFGATPRVGSAVGIAGG